MSKNKEPKRLNELPQINENTDIHELWWDERTKVKMMTDIHIENAIKKLKGLGREEYDSSPYLKAAWIGVLEAEMMLRERERLASFHKNNNQNNV